MHVLYIHQHFAVPTGTTGTRSYEFARRWVKAGHKVTVVTGYYDIGGLEVGKGLTQRQTIDGINVVIVGTMYSNKQSFLMRIISFLCFMFFSVWAGLGTKNVDVIYATSTPLTVGIPAMVLKFLKRVPFVFEVRDEWPLIPIEMGVLKNRLLIKMLQLLEKQIYKSSSAIVALSPGMAGGVRSVIGPDKQIEVMSNSSDTDVFTPDVDGRQIRQKYGWADKLVCLHFGAMGKANGLGFLVEVAEKVKENSSIHFVIIGDGATKPALEEKVANLNLKNIEFLGSIPKTEMPQYVAACDIALVVFADYPILQHNSANKFFDSLSAGKPVLINYSGWQRAIIEDGKAGFGCQQCNLDEFVEKIVYLNSNTQQLEILGKNARLLAEKKYNRDLLSSKVLKVLENVVKS